MKVVMAKPANSEKALSMSEKTMTEMAWKASKPKLISNEVTININVSIGVMKAPCISYWLIKWPHPVSNGIVTKSQPASQLSSKILANNLINGNKLYQ